MRRVLLALTFGLFASSALAQQAVQQSGNVTPGHPVAWVTNGVVGDAGAAARSSIAGIGTTASGPSICANSGPVTAAYNALCLGTTLTTGADFSLTNNGGATGGMTFTLNGVTGLQINGTATQSQGSLGYGPAGGSVGGAVTQLTSRTTSVSLNKISGQITMFSAAGSATAATFTVANNLVAATDTIILNQQSGTNLYQFFVTAIVDGTSFNITFLTTGGTATDAPVINFAIFKAVAN